MNGLTILHHAASQGNTAAVEAILRSASKSKRRELAQVQDNYGNLVKGWGGEHIDNIGVFSIYICFFALPLVPHQTTPNPF